ncbi:glycerophosphodiester phosphodiesterase family protein [Novosphingobium sp. NPDC080210]|uniref:glycerophosphodiester phosphodiesterase family protein n=1 Tax=Novosphingobium sp. NPDC080210 TaxID=3390596 RepID=UPI003D091DD4
MRLSPFALLDRWLAPAPGPGKADWLGGAEYAHRGLHLDGVPENSLSAFRGAMARGMGIECDVQLTRDGQAVVFHDFDLDRLTAERGPVAARTAESLFAIALAGTADHIPTLPQLLAEVAGRVPILIEIKSRRGDFAPFARLCQAVADALEGYAGPHAIMSFDPRVVHWFARHRRETVRGLVMTEEHDRGLSGLIRRHLFLWRARPHFMAYDIRDLPSAFAAAQRQRGLPVLTWTVRSAELRQRAALHADAPIAEGAGVP